MKRIRKRRQLKLKNKILLIILLIVFFTYFFIHLYFKKINNKIIDLATMKIDNVINNILSKDIGYDLLKDVDAYEILKITKNNNGEILNVDFNLEASYKILANVTDEINTETNLFLYGKYNFNDDYLLHSSKGLILKMPLFNFSSNALISNFGPDIYLKIKFNDTILTNLKTKITNYGLNNALVEIYIPLEITYELLTPITSNKSKINYDVLIASKIINGRVPYLYGDTLVKEGNLIEQKIT